MKASACSMGRFKCIPDNNTVRQNDKRYVQLNMGVWVEEEQTALALQVLERALEKALEEARDTLKIRGKIVTKG